MKTGTDSNQPLLGVDPSSPTKRSIFGVTVYWSPYVDEGAVWGIPQAKVFVVLRQDAELVVDSSRYFESDRLGIRATLRVAFGFPTRKPSSGSVSAEANQTVQRAFPLRSAR